MFLPPISIKQSCLSRIGWVFCFFWPGIKCMMVIYAPLSTIFFKYNIKKYRCNIICLLQRNMNMIIKKDARKKLRECISSHVKSFAFFLGNIFRASISEVFPLAYSSSPGLFSLPSRHFLQSPPSYFDRFAQLHEWNVNASFFLYPSSLLHVDKLAPLCVRIYVHF